MIDYPADTIAGLLARGPGAAPAIGAPGRPWLSYDALREQAAATTAALNRAGIGRGDRLAIVLPNGPEMAAFFVCAAGACTTAPLNPAYKPDEFSFYLDDLHAAALVVLAGAETPARAVAAARHIPVIELTPGEAAGSFSLATGGPLAAKQPGPATADDVALVLHTSGTTSRPKIVPLTQRNVTASAYHIGESLALSTEDVCLNIMPLFHIHGLIAAVLASLAAGGAVSCTPGFNAFAFFAQFDEVRPTWLTAVPTMHQTLLTRAARHAQSIAAGRLRLIRSSSASLPPAVMAELEATFGVPVIESYGMTEAAHQMASNPLPPRPRHPGSVGLAAGPQIAIMGLDGEMLPAGAPGEIVIRGRNVTAGYENNPDANAKAFTDGWFRTGDEGVLDEAGYLRLTGRLKEIINRGGEKISPLEVDNALMDHPDVAQALTFAIPHDKLGEEVAACIVLRDGAAADEHAIRDFVGEHLAPFKVPRRIVFLPEIPKGPTGKLMRIGLAKKLGLSA
jgi:acyl-CoA synthetase (AMP-forming)/AMP-acid ligase II